MTRRGSLAYYLTVWVVGCFFMILAIFVADAIALRGSTREFLRNIASNFLFAYFFGLIYGASTALLYGFILRRLMIWNRATRIWQWFQAGSILVIPFFFTFRWMEPRLHFSDPGGNFLAILIGGPLTSLVDNYRILLPAILAGGLTAAALSYVHRAFGQELPSSDDGQG
jgi:hypothetical protein